MKIFISLSFLILFNYCTNKIPSGIKQNEIEYLKEVNRRLDNYVDSCDKFCLKFRFYSNKLNDLKHTDVFIVEQIKSNYYIKRYDLKNKKILYRELYPAFFEGINNKFIFLNNQVHYLANYEFYNKNNNLDTNSAINFIYNFRVNKDKVIYEFSISENYTDFQNAKQIAEAIKLLLHIITESEFVPELYTKIEDFDDEF